MRRFGMMLLMIISLMANIHAEQASKESVTKLYVATFNRAGEQKGLDYWINSGLSLEDIAKSFFDQPETKTLYPDGYDTYSFVRAVYNNLFGRDPDSEGGDYWQRSLDNGSVSKSVFILAVVNGALGDDAQILDNKTQVGLMFADSGINDIGTSRDVMGNVTSNNQTIADSFNKINNIQIDGDGNVININNNDSYDFSNTTNNYYYYINESGEVTQSKKPSNGDSGDSGDSSNNNVPTLKAVISTLGTHKYSANNSNGDIAKYEWVMHPRKDAQVFAGLNYNAEKISNAKTIRLEQGGAVPGWVYDESDGSKEGFSLPYGDFDLELIVTDNNGKTSSVKKTIKLKEDRVIAYVEYHETFDFIGIDASTSRSTADNAYVNSYTWYYNDEYISDFHYSQFIFERLDDGCWYVSADPIQDVLVTCDVLDLDKFDLMVTDNLNNDDYWDGSHYWGGSYTYEL